MIDGVESKILDVTVAVATDIMHKNTKNRPVSKTVVTKYSKIMKAGGWQFNAEPVIISKDGRLLDGQHRLMAIIASKVPQKMLVVTGVEGSAFKTIDVGHKRTGGDALATHSKELAPKAIVIAATVKIINQFDSDGIFHESKRSSPLSHSELIDYVEDHKTSLFRAVDFCSGLSGAKKFIPWSALSALYFLFSKVDFDKSEIFFHKLSTGENLKAGEPVLLLRQRLINIRNSGGILWAREAIPFVLKAWELTREEKTLERLRIDEDYIPRIV